MKEFFILVRRAGESKGVEAKVELDDALVEAFKDKNKGIAKEIGAMAEGAAIMLLEGET